MKGVAVLVILIIVASIGASMTTASPKTAVYSHDSQGGLKKFGSGEEMESFLRTNLRKERVYYSTGLLDGLFGQSVVTASLSVPSSSSRYASYDGLDFSYTIGGDASYSKIDDTETTSADYSTTNVQIKEVDEADIVKSDGRYLYVLAKSKVFIVDAYPTDQARILSMIKMEDTPVELFVKGEKLVILGDSFVKIYNISNKSSPVLASNISFNGHYFASRMVGDFVYLILNTGQINSSYSPNPYSGFRPTTIFSEKVKIVQDVVSLDITLPKITIDNKVHTIQASEINYFDVKDTSYGFITVMAIDTQKENEQTTSETYVTGLARNIFVSSNNIYITFDASEKTIVHKFAIDGTNVKYKGSGEFPGLLLNQFSMDEYAGYFRVATTSRKKWTLNNNIYVLDENLITIGRLEGIAPRESIYSARFIGERAYLVTFRRTDPFFVIDLKDPQNPKILGELEIPGYSDYLHPYDDNHIIGIGKEQGVKIALFDVSIPEDPKEISKYDAGSGRTDSHALQDHKAFLFSRSKNLLVIPIENNWLQNAHVFHISFENGIVLKGEINHFENRESRYSAAFSTRYNNYYSEKSVKRALYIESILYTISDGFVKMNNMSDLSPVNQLELN